MSRDPRLEPRPGDILRGTGADGQQRYVNVHWVGYRDQVGFVKGLDIDGNQWSPERMPLAQFVEQAHDAEVIHTAEEPNA